MGDRNVATTVLVCSVQGVALRDVQILAERPRARSHIARNHLREILVWVDSRKKRGLLEHLWVI